MRRLILVCTLGVVLTLAGCGSDEVTAPTATPAQAAAPTATAPLSTPAPTAIMLVATEVAENPTSPPQPTEDAADVSAAQVERDFRTSVGLAPTGPLTTPIEGPGIDGVVVFPLDGPADWPAYWAAHTTGLRSFERNQRHEIALYTQDAGDGVREVVRILLSDNNDATEQPTLAPDYLGVGSVTQAPIEPNAIWLQVEGGVGAHSGVYGLLRFDGAAITQELVAANSAPGIGDLVDLDGDGVMEVITDASDYYVFCYACGVRLTRLNLWRWDGQKMTQVELSPLPPAAPLELSAANDRALQLAEAGLWRDALKSVEDGLMLGLTDPSQTFAWNASLIRLNADALRSVITGGHSAYPLLDFVFYGDYASAVNLMRPLTPQEVFSSTSPLIVGTVAEGWEETLANWLRLSSDAALSVMPDLAPAHFIHGWASHLVGDQDQAIRSIGRAAALAPDDPFYRASLTYLDGDAAKRTGMLTPLTAVNVRSGPGAAYPIVGELAAGVVATVTGRFAAGDERWWQIDFTDAPERRGWVTGNPALVEVTKADNAPLVTPPALVTPITARGRIFFSAPGETGVNTIFVMDAVAGAQPAVIISEAVMPALRSQGDRLAFTSQRSDMLGLGGLVLATGERLRFSYNIEDTLPSWNPDGDRLIFASTRESDRRWRLYRVWADGSGEAEDLGFGQDPAWRPSGDQVVYKGCDQTGAACGLWLMNADGGNRRSLTTNPGDARPRWSPDGASVVFMSNERADNWEIYRVAVADGSVIRLTDHPANDGLPVFSPDSSRIAFLSDRNGEWELLVIPATGGAPLVLHEIGPYLPDWLEQGLEWGK